MDFKVLLICCILAVTHSRHLDSEIMEISSRIVGGTNSSLGEFPHQISLQFRWENVSDIHFCGGAVLNERWILTAGHCVNFQELPSSMYYIVKAGKYNLHNKEPDEQVALIEKYFQHELYYEIKGTVVNDVGLIKLKTPLKLNDRVVKIALPEKDSEPNGSVTLSGWGSINPDPEDPLEPSFLQTVSLTIVDRKTCNEALNKFDMDVLDMVFFPYWRMMNFVRETNICTGPITGGISACSGDSGSPLVKTNKEGKLEVVGIASWVVAPCGTKGAPSVFVRVSSYIDWIQYKIDNN